MKDTKNNIRYKELFEGFKAVRQYFILAGSTVPPSIS